MIFKEDLMIIRHARSLHNIKATTDLDSGISDWGEVQSTNVGNFLCEELDLEDFFWYTSPFLRCLQTARHIWQAFVDAKGSYTPYFRVLPSAREYLNHAGREVFVPNRRSEFTMFDWDGIPTTGEKYEAEFNEVFLHRMHECYGNLRQKSVVVTHGMPCLTLFHIATENIRHVPMWDYSMDNASITWVKHGRSVWHGKNLYHELESWPKDGIYTKLLGKKAPVKDER